MTEAPTTLHPDDGEIIRWLDDAASPAERASLDIHLASCGACEARRVMLSHRADRLSALLRETDVPAPTTSLRAVVRRRKARPTMGWRIAASILLILSAATAVTPVRAWFAGVAKGVLASFRGTAKPVDRSDGSVSFVPTSAQLTVRVPAGQGGTLTIEAVDGDRITAAGGGAGILVLPDELRFTDDRAGTRQYVVRVPLRAESIRVLVDPGSIRVLRPKTVGERWTIPLDSPGDQRRDR